MSQEPKKRHSRGRQGKRRASISLHLLKAIKCANCGAPTLPHVTCKKCGFYDGKQVFVLKVKEKKE